jgi:hypothetical protein
MFQSKAMLHRQCAENRILTGSQEIREVGFIIGNTGHIENIQAVAFEQLYARLWTSAFGG